MWGLSEGSLGAALTPEGLFFCSFFPDSVKRLFGQLLLVAGTNYQPHLILVAHPRSLHCFHGATRLERPCSLFRPRSVHSGIAEGLSVLAACVGLCGTCVPLLQSQGQGQQPVPCSVSGVLAWGCPLRACRVGASLQLRCERAEDRQCLVFSGCCACGGASSHFLATWA